MRAGQSVCHQRDGLASGFAARQHNSPPMSLVVIGGTVLDVQAQPHDVELQRGSSVPGQVVQVPGGVGRNIAEAAHHLLDNQQQQRTQQQQYQQPQLQPQQALLISVVGQDAAADALLAHFKQHRMSTAGIIRSKTVSTPCVVSVLDRGGEVAACVADVAAPATHLTAAIIQQHTHTIQEAGMLILDANLEQPTLIAAVQAAAAAGVPVLFEPVSVPKSVRCVPILKHLTFITPNPNELLAIAAAVTQQAIHHSSSSTDRSSSSTNSSSSSTNSSSSSALFQPSRLDDLQSPQQLLAYLAPAAAAVLQQGLKHIILTMGAKGAALISLEPISQQQQQQQQQGLHHHQHQSKSSSVSYSSARRQHLVAHHIPAAAAAAVVNLSGAGDTLTGAFAAAVLRGASPQQALAMGVAAAKLAVEFRVNVPGPAEGMVYSEVWRGAQQLLAKLQIWHFPVAPAL